MPWADWQGKSNEGLVQLLELKLKLHGWSQERRVIVERRLNPLNASRQGTFWKQCVEDFSNYVTNLTIEEADAFQIVALYRQRAGECKDSSVKVRTGHWFAGSPGL